MTMVSGKAAQYSQLYNVQRIGILKTLWHGALCYFSWRPNWDCTQFGQKKQQTKSKKTVHDIKYLVIVDFEILKSQVKCEWANSFLHMKILPWDGNFGFGPEFGFPMSSYFCDSLLEVSKNLMLQLSLLGFKNSSKLLKGSACSLQEKLQHGIRSLILIHCQSYRYEISVWYFLPSLFRFLILNVQSCISNFDFQQGVYLCCLCLLGNQRQNLTHHQGVENQRIQIRFQIH